MNAAEIIARLSAAGEKLAGAQAKAVAAAQDASEARALVAGALEGGAPGQLVGLIDRVRDSLARAGSTAEPAKHGLQETIAKVKALGN
jgi:hypothetical protein